MTEWRAPRRPDQRTNAAGDDGGHGHGGHLWVMLLCCAPMVIAALFIVFGR